MSSGLTIKRDTQIRIKREQKTRAVKKKEEKESSLEGI